MTFNVDLLEYTFPTPVKILMLVGQYTNPENCIDTTQDEQLIQNLRGAEANIVRITSIREVTDALYNNEFDILIFAGHSRTLLNGNDTTIWVTDNVTFNIADIRPQISKALRRTSHPLVLAIFNSCDGLGIGNILSELDTPIPYLIAMKALIPDEIAHRFLEVFLRCFAKERMEFENAYQQAKTALRPHDGYADLLPILCLQRRIMPHLFWSDNTIITNDPNTIVSNDPNTIVSNGPNTIVSKNDKLWIKTTDFISKLWRKKITRYLGLLIITILIVVIVALSNRPPVRPIPEPIVFCQQKNQAISKYISCGEKSLVENNISSDDENLGIDAFKKNNYSNAINYLKKPFDQEQKNQETKNYESGIFLENAKVLELQETNKNLQIFPVAVVVPTMDFEKKELYLTTQAILQGVYNQQKDFNDKNPKNKLFVLIANDKNDSNNKETNQLGKATLVAKELVQRSIYAIIGPYSSQVAMETKDIYRNNQIVVMSYANTATQIIAQGKLIKLEGPFFYRVCSNNKGIAIALANKLKNNKFILFLKNDDLFSQSFGWEFDKYRKQKSQEKFMNTMTSNEIEAILKDAQSQRVDIVLCPGAYTKQNNDDEKYKYVKNTNDLLKKDRKELLIAGCNVITTYKEAIKEGGNYKNIIVGVPWFYDENDETVTKNPNFQRWKEIWNKQNANDPKFMQKDTFMRMVLAQDATMVLTTALSEVSKQPGKPSGTELRDYLAKNTFQGVTGEISFTGSDRTLDTSKVITPKCNDQECKNWNGEWEVVN